MSKRLIYRAGFYRLELFDLLGYMIPNHAVWTSSINMYLFFYRFIKVGCGIYAATRKALHLFTIAAKSWELLLAFK